MRNKINLAVIILALLSSAFISNDLFAQNSVQDITGKNWRTTSTYSEVVGTPFLSNDWAKGVIKFSNNESKSGVDLKYDQIADVLLFKSPNGETLEVVDPILEFKIEFAKAGLVEQRLFRAGFKPVGDFNDKTFYEILSDGNVKFIKKDIKTIIEEKGYNEPVAAKKIVNKTYYYIVKDNLPIVTNKNEKSILSAIGDKTTELSAYIKTNKLNLKNDADILKVLEYYFGISK